MCLWFAAYQDSLGGHLTEYLSARSSAVLVGEMLGHRSIRLHLNGHISKAIQCTCLERSSYAYQVHVTKLALISKSPCR